MPGARGEVLTRERNPQVGLDLFELSLSQAPGEGLLAAAIDLVLQERLKRPEIADFIPLCFLEAEVKSVEHPAQAQNPQVSLQLMSEQGRSLLSDTVPQEQSKLRTRRKLKSYTT